MRTSSLFCLALLALTARPAAAGEAHYLLLFGSQRVPNNPNYAHSFAVFARVRWAGDGPCRGPFLIEAHTISWLPANMKVRVNALLPECGKNFELHETIRFVRDTDQRLSMWGPYPIEPELYDRALARIDLLNSGRVRYKANDTRYPGDSRVVNCIHAISPIAGGLRLRVASPGWGESASYAILRRLRPWVLEDEPHHWLSSALGLDEYPIIYRERIAPPRSGAVLGPVLRLLGSERGLSASYGPPGGVTAPLPTAPPTAP